jgi:hypothetical protein
MVTPLKIGQIVKVQHGDDQYRPDEFGHGPTLVKVTINAHPEYGLQYFKARRCDGKDQFDWWYAYAEIIPLEELKRFGKLIGECSCQ